MKLLLLFLLGVFLTQSRPLWHQLEQGYTFQQYANDFKKIYPTIEEHNDRKLLFDSRLQQILTHNRRQSTWKMGVNHLMDHSDEELRSMHGVKKELVYLSRKNDAHVEAAPLKGNVNLPSSVDWRVKGVVSPVKDQGKCGSCWSFAAAETVESIYAIATGQLVELSEQQILDCTANPKHCGGTGGCHGATAELAFDTAVKSGLATEWTYPYVSYSGKDFTCNPSITPYATVSKYVTLPTNQQEPLMDAIANIGPIAISVDASSWHFYDSGVFDGCNQTNPDIDHAVQLVGYGTDDKLGDYWIVRNSWSPKWGEKGYIRVKRESKPRCGIDLTPYHGVECDGGPPTVKVCGTCGILYDSAYVSVTKK
jgi:cathepsin L